MFITNIENALNSDSGGKPVKVDLYVEIELNNGSTVSLGQFNRFSIIYSFKNIIKNLTLVAAVS
jgi:hypothetical protein